MNKGYDYALISNNGEIIGYTPPLLNAAVNKALDECSKRHETIHVYQLVGRVQPQGGIWNPVIT